MISQWQKKKESQKDRLVWTNVSQIKRLKKQKSKMLPLWQIAPVPTLAPLWTFPLKEEMIMGKKKDLQNFIALLTPWDGLQAYLGQ